MSINAPTVDTGVIVRRSLFFLVLIGLTLGNVFPLFRGLNSQQAMDQAQIAREMARGNGLTTKFIRPAAYHQAQQAQEVNAVPFVGFQDTYHAPLNPLILAAVFKIIGADDVEAWKITNDEMVHPLDRVVATVSTLCFLLAIGVTYLLVCRIFDAKIAGVCALLMLFSETYWQFSLSGLPQMLMLLLFSCALYFIYRATEAAGEGRMAMAPALIAGVFLTLLALTHWIAVWIALGYILFAAFAFRPRGVVGLSVMVLLILAAILPVLRAVTYSDSVFGTAFLTLFNGLSAGGGDAIMRSHDLEGDALELQGLFTKITRTTLLQLSDIVPFLGGILIAPLFFISLLHPFKRASIASFRWAVLLMFLSGAVGLAFFGVSARTLDPNQIHLLFAPVMTAYALAFLSILWGRLEVVTVTPILRNAHLVVVVIVCALPLLLALPRDMRMGMERRKFGGIPQWPPYFAPVLNLGLRGIAAENEVIFSDQPWAVAWYADRIAIWLPRERAGFDELEKLAADLNTPVAGILISPSSHESGHIRDIRNQYRDFTSLVMDGRTAQYTGTTLADKDPRMESIFRRYRYRMPMVDNGMIFYSDRVLQPSAAATTTTSDD